MNKKLAGEIAAGLNDANLPPVTNKQVEPFAPPPPIHRPCGCDSCDRLAEAFEAMREALTSTINTLNLHDTGEQVFGAAYPDSRADCLRRVRAALTLADKVGRP